MTTPTRWFKASSSSRNGSSINNLMPLMDSYVSYFYVFIILRNNSVLIASTWIPCSFIETVFTPLSIINIFNANRCSLITNDTNQHSWIGVAFNKSLRSMELIYEITEFQIEIFWSSIFKYSEWYVFGYVLDGLSKRLGDKMQNIGDLWLIDYEFGTGHKGLFKHSKV